MKEHNSGCFFKTATAEGKQGKRDLFQGKIGQNCEKTDILEKGQTTYGNKEIAQLSWSSYHSVLMTRVQHVSRHSSKTPQNLKFIVDEQNLRNFRYWRQLGVKKEKSAKYLLVCGKHISLGNSAARKKLRILANF